jgi:chitodextrinase
VTLPLLAYPRSEGSAVIGGAFYTATNYPEVYRGSYFFADYVGDWIRRVVFDANGNPTSISTFATEVGSPVTLELGPDGNLYYISFTTGQIRRIRFNGPNAVATASPSSGYSPLQVFFSSQGSSAPGGGQLTYLWDFGDGSTSAQANPVHTYATGGVTTFVATLTVTTTTNAKASSTVKVTVGSLPPVPTIALPADGTVFLPGQIVTYQGSANDPDQGALPPSALHWDVLLHHNTHIHVSTTNTGSAQGSFVVEDHGIGSYAYEIILTATDASGLTGSTSVLLPVAADTTPPTPPTGLIATAVNANQVSLSWTASTDNVAVLSYRVERCQGAGCSNFAEIVTTANTNHIDLGLVASTSYSYRVRANDTGGNFGAYSNVATVITGGSPPADTTPPTAPNGLSGTPLSSSQINLSWTAATDNVGVTGYRVERCAGTGCSNFAEIATPTGTTFNNSGLAPATTYTYRVRATDAAGNLSAYSNQSSATTTQGPSPGGGLVAAYGFDEGSGSTASDASGNGNTGSISGATWTTQGKYGSALSFNGVDNLVAISGSASLNVTTGMTLEGWINPTATQSGWRTMMQRQPDSYFLNASTSAGPLRPGGGGTINGDVSMVTGPTASPVNSWTHLALTFEGTTLTLYVNGTAVATQPAIGTLQTNSNPLRIGGNVPYGEFFQGLIDEVRVYNRALSAAEIQADMVTPVASGGTPDASPPTAPSTLTATATSATQIDLNWSAATDNVGVTGYRVERCSGSGCTTFSEIASPTTLTFSDVGRTAATTYRYRVRATDTAGNLGPYSPIAFATTPGVGDTTPPTAPATLTVTAISATQIDLSWSAATDNVGVVGYRLERCTGSTCTNFVEIATPTTLIFSDSGRTAATTYRYQVRATDTAGNLGPYSPIATATTPSAPPVPPGLAAAYGFNEGAGSTATDASGNGNTGTISGAAWTTQGRFGQALDFNGVDNLLVIAASTSLNLTAGMTLEAWIYPTAAQSGWRTIMQRQPDAYFLNASTSAGPLQPGGGGTINGGVSLVTAPTASPVNSWTHVALTHDGATLTLYFNGTTVATQAAPGALETNANPLHIGGNVPYGEFFQGRIDEVRVYNRALSAAEIQADMATPVGGSAPTDTTPPTAPAMLTATPVSATQIDLSWSPATDDVSVTGYRVERCTGATCTNFAQIATPTTLTFSDAGGTPATTYRYQVRAVDAAGNLGAYSPVATATTPSAPDTTSPAAPATLTATAVSATQIDLSWSAATDNVGVTGYRVERCTGPTCTNFAQIATPTTLTFSDGGRTAATTYRYQVRAVDAAGNLGAYSPIATATTPAGADTMPPTAPATLTATAASATQIGLSWSAATDNVGVTGYRVERCTGATCTNFVQIATPTATTFSDIGRAPSTTYRYRVRAADAAGNLGPYSPIAAATTPTDTTAPTAPGTLTATTFSATRIDLSWSAATDNVAVTGYRVERCTGAGCTNFAQIATRTVLNYSDTGRSSGTTYRYRVRAADAAGNLGPYSPIATATTTDATAPTAPTTLTASAASPTQVNLSWSASTDNVGVTGYRVERCTGAGCTTFAEIASSATLAFSDGGRTASTTYRYRVRAADAAGNLGSYSPIATAITPSVADIAPPTAPATLTATAISATQIDLNWSAATDNVGVAGYRVERCIGTGCTTFGQVAAPTTLTLSDGGRTAATTYRYQVRAVDAVGNLGLYSPIATATTPAAPPVPPTLVAAYSFNEGSGGTVTDSSGNGNAGVISGATWTTQGRFGQALDFNGINNLIVVAGSGSLNLTSGMTLEAWVYPTASQTGWRTVMQREVDAYFLNASTSAGALRPGGGATINGGVSTVTGPTAVPVGVWTHLAITHDGTTLTFYVNGTAVATQSASGAIETNANSLRIGGNVPYGEFFQGRIDEVRVYNRSLSAAEIQADMTTALP